MSTLPVYNDLPPLYLTRSSTPGLLPTPDTRPLRRVVWLGKATPNYSKLLKEIRNIKKSSRFSLLESSTLVDYAPSSQHMLNTMLYGEGYADLLLKMHEIQLKRCIPVEPLTQRLFDAIENYKASQRRKALLYKYTVSHM